MTVDEMLELVDKRQDGFKLMINAMRQLHEPLIVETGCCREENAFKGDGMSTLIWDGIVNEKNAGQVYSVDLSPEAVIFASNKVGGRTSVFNGDSIQFLSKLEQDLLNANRTIDLLYLDSYDFDVNNPHPSSLHHIFELLSIKGALRKRSDSRRGTLVAVDDNFFHWGQWMGKGIYVAGYMNAVGKPMVHQGYQWIWEW